MENSTFWGGESAPEGETTLWTSVQSEPWHTFETVDPSQWPADKINWTWLISEATGSSEFEMGICRLEPGGKHILHHHPQRAELYYVISGTAAMTLGEETRKVGPGDAQYIPAGLTHGFVNDGDAVFEIVFVYDNPPGLERPDYVLDEEIA
jgi:mannose-6-phosphate isomerase-like protein (cupin superfamily)